MLDFHNFQLSVDPAGDPAVTGHGDTTPTAADSAGDPEIEKLEYNIPAETSHGDNTPTAAWILLSLFLLSCLQKTYSDNVISEISQHIVETSLHGNKRNKPFSKRLMIFCLTLAGYSTKAYSYLRTVVNNSIPSRETLRKYRNRVDGSPGFSSAALKMVRRKVAEMESKSKKIFLSLSCDDMSIRLRYIFCIEKNVLLLYLNFRLRGSIKPSSSRLWQPCFKYGSYSCGFFLFFSLIYFYILKEIYTSPQTTHLVHWNLLLWI